MPQVLPIFPLEAVLFPGVLMPLRLFEQRYLNMLEDLQRDAARQASEMAFGIVALRSGASNDPAGTPDVYDIGCTAVVRRVTMREPRVYDIAVAGDARVTVGALSRSDRGYFQAEVHDYPAPGPESHSGQPDAEAVAGDALDAFTDYLQALGSIGGTSAAELHTDALPTDLPALSWLIASAANVPRAQQQLLLEVPTDLDRLRYEMHMLRREAALIRRLRSLPIGPEFFVPPSRQN